MLLAGKSQKSDRSAVEDEQIRKDTFSSDGLLKDANVLLRNGNMAEGNEATRRLFFASALIGAGMAVAPTPASAATEKWGVRAVAYSGSSNLPWQATPVNKRTGTTVFAAEKTGYNVPFVTYLSRFLLCFDKDCQRWWYNRASDLPRTATAEEVNQLRLNQFGAFSASVEVGLQDYRGPDGPKALLQSMKKRFCPDLQTLKAGREAAGQQLLSEKEEKRLKNEIQEARRQIALLFGLMEQNQPVKEITKLLAAIDNGGVSYVLIKDPGSGYAPGYGPPEVYFPPPESGEPNDVTATGRAILRENGKILRIDVVNRGIGFSKPPTVTISPPASIRFGEGDEEGRTAEAKAFISRSGENKGKIDRIQLTDQGEGYGKHEIIRIRISPPDLPREDGGEMATACPVLELEVAAIQITTNGTGYAVEQPIYPFVEAPPLTARVNMLDPRWRSASDPSDSKALADANNGGKGGGGGCVGRACYDKPVKAIAYASAEFDSYNAFRDENDMMSPQRIENAINIRSATAVRGTGSSSDIGNVDLLSFGGGQSWASSQLLSLLPAGVGLSYCVEEGRYQLEIDPFFQEKGLGRALAPSPRAIDPEFGPRGRSPIEQEKQLGIGTYLRFVASGAICSSGVHLALTPIDVVKTKVR
jgi:hypothetical protein